KLLGKELDELVYSVGGLNHFHWHKVSDLAGNDVTRKIIDRLDEETNGTPAHIMQWPFSREHPHEMNMVPYAYHDYHYQQEDPLEHMLEEYNNLEDGTRAQQVKQTEAELFDLYKNPDLNYKPEQLSARGGAYYSDSACETIVSIYANKN